jgi:sarcosine oxidase gamma subunit
MTTQRHLEAAFLPSGNYQYDINIVESFARTLSQTLEEDQPVHHYSIMHVF